MTDALDPMTDTLATLDVMSRKRHDPPMRDTEARSVFVVAGHSFREVPLPSERGLLLVTGGVIAANGTRTKLASGSAMIFAQRVSLSLRTSACAAVGFAHHHNTRTRVLSPAQIANDTHLQSLAALLRDHPNTSSATPHLVEAFILRACEVCDASQCTDSAVTRAIDIVERDLGRRWSTSELARAVGLSRAAFARRFAAAMGAPPDRHFTVLKLQHAARRLATSDDGIAKIAADVGYRSEFAFSRAFKRFQGIAPAHYRQHLHQPGHTPIRMAA